MFSVQVPQGVVPGSMFSVQTPDGAIVQVQCPAGSGPGSTIQLQGPPSQQDPDAMNIPIAQAMDAPAAAPPVATGTVIKQAALPPPPPMMYQGAAYQQGAAGTISPCAMNWAGMNCQMQAGFILLPIAICTGVLCVILNAVEAGLTPTLATGAVATVGYIVAVPLMLSSVGHYRRRISLKVGRPTMVGNPGVHIAGWVLYAIGILDATALCVVGALDYKVHTYWIVIVVLWSVVVHVLCCLQMNIIAQQWLLFCRGEPVPQDCGCAC